MCDAAVRGGDSAKSMKEREREPTLTDHFEQMCALCENLTAKLEKMRTNGKL